MKTPSKLILLPMFCLLAVNYGCKNKPSSNNEIEEAKADRATITNLPTMKTPMVITSEENIPFVCYSFDDVIKLWDKDCKEVEVQRDLDNDGVAERFTIGPGQWGIQVVLYKGEYGDAYNFEAGTESQNQYIQLNFTDLDKDGKEELIMAYSSSIIDFELDIFKVRDAEEDSYKNVGTLESSPEPFVLKGNHFHCAAGMRMTEEYIYSEGKLYQQME